MTAPVPPLPLPPGAIVSVPGRGEFFVRDTGGTGPVVLLLHGWMFPSDLNWLRQYAPLRQAGYRVLPWTYEATVGACGPQRPSG